MLMTSTQQKTELIVRAILIHNGNILINSWRNGYSFFPGGKVKHGEALNEALMREIKEELGFSIRSARLIYLIENFFIQSDKSIHEMGFYYLASCDEKLFGELRDQVNPDDDDLRFEMIPLTRIGEYDLRPSIIRESLLNDFENRFREAPYHLVSKKS